jgi:hypothetical protein
MVGHFCRVELLDPNRHAAHLYDANALDSEGRIWTYLPYGSFETLESYLGWMNNYCRGDDPLFHAIVDNATGKAVGVASYLRITPASGSIEVGHINYSPLAADPRGNGGHVPYDEAGVRAWLPTVQMEV